MSYDRPKGTEELLQEILDELRRLNKALTPPIEIRITEEEIDINALADRLTPVFRDAFRSSR